MQVSKIAVSNGFSANQNQKTRVQNQPNFGNTLKGDPKGFKPAMEAAVKTADALAEKIRREMLDVTSFDYPIEPTGINSPKPLYNRELGY